MLCPPSCSLVRAAALGIILCWILLISATRILAGSGACISFQSFCLRGRLTAPCKVLLHAAWFGRLSYSFSSLSLLTLYFRSPALSFVSLSYPLDPAYNCVCISSFQAVLSAFHTRCSFFRGQGRGSNSFSTVGSPPLRLLVRFVSCTLA